MRHPATTIATALLAVGAIALTWALRDPGEPESARIGWIEDKAAARPWTGAETAEGTRGDRASPRPLELQPTAPDLGDSELGRLVGMLEGAFRARDGAMILSMREALVAYFETNPHEIPLLVPLSFGRGIEWELEIHRIMSRLRDIDPTTIEQYADAVEARTDAALAALPEGAVALQSAILDPTAKDRALAVRKLVESHQDDPEVATFLEGLLANGDDAIRPTALFALMEIGGESATGAFEDFFDDPNPNVRRAVIRGLKWVGEDWAADMLVRATGDPETALVATSALGEYRENRQATDILIRASFDHARPTIQETAVTALGRHASKNPDAHVALMELVDSTRDTALARLAIREVQKGADRQATAAFLEDVASGHWSGVVQREARKALERMR